MRLPTAVEQGHLMPARKRVSHLMGPGETGAAEYQDLQRTHRGVRSVRANAKRGARAETAAAR